MRKEAVLVVVALTLVAAGAYGKSIEELKRAGDLAGLTAKLRDKDGAVRCDAAVALSGVTPGVRDAAALRRAVYPLLDATLRDTHLTVREYAGRALMSIFQRTEDESVLRPAAQVLVDAANHREVEAKRRRFAAVALWVVVPKVKSEISLKPMVPPLVVATLDDPDEQVREYAGRALLSIVQRIDDEATLKPTVLPLIAALSHKEIKMRRYSAWALANVVPKVQDKAMLRRIIPSLETAVSKGQHVHIREYAGRALKSIQARLSTGEDQ
jgi:HEAT repeat protein